MHRERSIDALPSVTVIACTGQIRSHFRPADARPADHTGPGCIDSTEPVEESKRNPPPDATPGASICIGFPEVGNSEGGRVIADRPDVCRVEEVAFGCACYAADLKGLDPYKPRKNGVHGRIVAPGQDCPDLSGGSRLGTVRSSWNLE